MSRYSQIIAQLCIVMCAECMFCCDQKASFGECPNPFISSVVFLDCSNTRDNYTIPNVQEHQRGMYSRYEGVTDDT